MANIKIPQLGSAQIINDTNYLIVDDGLNTMKATAKQIKEYATNDVKAEIAENWTENVNYTVGNVVNWNGTIYRCIQNNLSSESLTPANATYWEDKTIGDMIYSLNSNYTNISTWKSITFTGSYTGSLWGYHNGKIGIIIYQAAGTNNTDGNLTINITPKCKSFGVLRDKGFMQLDTDKSLVITDVTNWTVGQLVFPID